MDDLVAAGQGVELVRRGAEVHAGDVANLQRHGLAELLGGVQPRADGGAAQGQVFHELRGGHDHGLAAFKHAHPAADLLSQREGSGVLQMGAADLDQVHVALGLFLQALMHLFKAGNDLFFDSQHGGDVKRRGIGVVAALAAVHVVVGVDLPAQAVRRDMGDDLVHVHVALGAAAGLPDFQRKFVPVVAGQKLFGRVHDGLGDLHVQDAEAAVGGGGSFLEDQKGLDDLPGHGLGANAEVLQAPLGLSAPVVLRGHFDLAHAVLFNTVIHVYSLLCRLFQFFQRRFIFQSLPRISKSDDMGKSPF